MQKIAPIFVLWLLLTQIYHGLFDFFQKYLMQKIAPIFVLWLLLRQIYHELFNLSQKYLMQKVAYIFVLLTEQLIALWSAEVDFDLS